MSPEGSGSCSGILSNTTADNSVSGIHSSMSWHFPVTWFWEVLPMNGYRCYYGEHSITQASRLFLEKQRSVQHGRAYRKDLIWLA